MEILGHRGRPCDATPENTLDSFAAALAAGADGVEVDVRLTADDVAVCCHDPGLERLAGIRRGLRSLTLADLTAVRVQGHPVPTLAAATQAVPADRSLVLDLKPEHRPHRLVAAVAGALAERHRSGVVLSSFDPAILDACARLLPDVQRAAILRDEDTFSCSLAQAVRRGDTAMHIPLRMVFANPDLVQAAHRHGMVVRVWTVNRAVDARLLKVLAVDAIITDVPETLRAALGPRLRLVGDPV